MHRFLPCLLLCATAHLHALDLSPRWIDTYAEGVPIRRLYFANGSDKITLTPDREAEPAAGLGGTVFRFKKFPDASFIVRKSTLTPAVPFDGPELDQYRAAARGLLPVGVQTSEIADEVRDPLPINNWRSYRVTLRFVRSGQPTQQSVTFFNLDEREQVALVTTAPLKFWDEIAARSFNIIRTWQPMNPNDLTLPTEN